MVTVNAVDSFACAYPEKVTKRRTTTDETVREPIDFTTNPANSKKTQDAATDQEVKNVEQAQKEYEEDKKNILQKFADKMKQIFSNGEDAAKTVGEGAIAGGVAGGILGLLTKGGLKGLLKGGATGAILALLGIGALALIGKLFGKEDKVPETKPEQPVEPEKPEPRIYTVKKGDNVWNIAKADLIETHKDDSEYKVTNTEIAKRTKELMDINGLEFEEDGYHVMIRPGDQLKLDPEEVKKEEEKEIAVA